MLSVDLKLYIGEKIKEFRLANGMSQEDLAEELNTTKQSVSRYENGDRQANQDILFKLAEIFKKRVDDFFPPIEKEYSVLDRLNDLSDEKFNIEDMMFLRKLVEKTLSLDEKEREKFLESIKFTVDYYEKMND